MLCKNYSIIILAAGQGKRMISNIPKVMHQVAGKSMLQHLIDSVIKIDVQAIYIVYNESIEEFIPYIYSNKYIVPIYWILQECLQGTGHAVRQVLPMIHDDEEVLILYGDVPLISDKTLKQLCLMKSQCDIGLLTAHVKDPQGYGRIIRNRYGDVVSVIEDVDIVNQNDRIRREINSGIFIVVSGYLKLWLNYLMQKQCNIKCELYLTAIVEVAYKSNFIIHTLHPINRFEVIGINNKSDLAKAERAYQIKEAQRLLELGVMILDPNRFDLRGTLICGEDVYIDINVIIEGYVSLGNRVKIGASCILKDVEIGDDVIIYSFSFIENSKINCNSKVGPFARLRPGTYLQEKTQIGNFVELKNIQLGEKSKVGHLSYLGDADIGNRVNIGAGTIICNYDGIRKNHTYIADNVFIGSDSQLIAPITIGKNAIIGAGTTVTQNVNEDDVIISRVRQFSILNEKNNKN